jgi:hypothetical protein
MLLQRVHEVGDIVGGHGFGPIALPRRLRCKKAANQDRQPIDRVILSGACEQTITNPHSTWFKLQGEWKWQKEKAATRMPEGQD